MICTWICLIAAPKIDKFDVFFSSAVIGSCRLSDSKHSFKCARRFFSSLLWTSRVPARTVDGLLNALLKYWLNQLNVDKKEINFLPVAIGAYRASSISAWCWGRYGKCIKSWWWINRNPLINHKACSTTTILINYIKILSIYDPALIKANVSQAWCCTIAYIATWFSA